MLLVLWLLACAPPPAPVAPTGGDTSTCGEPSVVVGLAHYYEHAPFVPLDDGDTLAFDVGPLAMWRTFIGLQASGVPEVVAVQVVLTAEDGTVLVDWSEQPVWLALPAWDPADCSGQACALEVLMSQHTIEAACAYQGGTVELRVALLDVDGVITETRVLAKAWLDPADGC